MSNEIVAYFKGRVGVAESVYQHDYGRVLVLDGLDMGTAFEAYYEVLGSTEAIPAIGQDNRVAIPNSCLVNAGKVTLHIPIHSGQNDSEVEYIVTFAVIGRAKPIDDGSPSEQSAIAQAIALLQNPITNIETIVNAALEFTGSTIDELKDSFDSMAVQFVNAIESVSSDTEVTNIRVGIDGTIYDTAGIAVRSQISDIRADLDPIKDIEDRVMLIDSAGRFYVEVE